MFKRSKCGPYILVDEVQQLSYGSLMRAVRTQGLAYLEHLHVLIPNEEAKAAGIEGLLDRHRDWFDAFEGIRQVDAAQVFEADESLKVSSPFFRGRSLAALLARNEEDRMLRLEHVLTFAQDMAVILGNLNVAGLAHGAVNLEGTWFDIDGSIRLIDASIGKVLIQAGLQKQALGPLAEHKVHFDLNFANDQESFGLILYHLMTGTWPNRASLEANVLELSMVQEEWGDQEFVVVPDSLKEVVLKSIKAEYPDGETFIAAVNHAYNHPDAEEFNATTFGAAFLLSSMFRTEMPGETEAIELEKSHEFMEAVGEVKVIEREKIVLFEDQRKRRIAILLIILGVVGATVGGGFLARASRHRAQQEQIRKETEGLMARYNREVDAYRKDEATMLERIANAQTPFEKEQLKAEFEKRRQVHEAELAAIRANIEKLQNQQKSLGGEAKPVPLAELPKAGNPSALPGPATTPSTTPPTTAPKVAQVEVPATAVVVQKDRVKINPDSIPFSPSAKTNMGSEAPPPVNTAPVYLSGPTKVEVLQRPSASGQSQKEDLQAVVPAVSVKDQRTANQFRRLVMPQLDKAALKDFEGQTVRIRVLVDQFGNAKSASVEECPKSLAADFKEAALKTQFNPMMENGRAKQAWIALSFRVTGAGITFDGSK